MSARKPLTNAERVCARFGIPIDVLDEADFSYLEKRGYRFCIDFGTENAAQVRDNHSAYERAKNALFLRKDQANQ